LTIANANARRMSVVNVRPWGSSLLQTFLDVVDSLRTVQADFVIHGLKCGRERAAVLGVISYRVNPSTGAASIGRHNAHRL
jgi:hypothetical protein